MATSGSNQVSIGARGLLRIEATVSSQDTAGKYSMIHLKLGISLTSGGPSGDTTGGCYAYFDGDIETDDGHTVTFSGVTTSWVWVLEGDYKVYHASDGTYTLVVAGHFGPTITVGLGDGGDVDLEMELPAIAVLPTKPSVNAVFYDGTNQATVTINKSTAPSSAPVDQYEVACSTNSARTLNFKSVTISGDLNYANLTPDTSVAQYFHVRAHNSVGWTDWSAAFSRVANPFPTAVQNLALVFSSPTAGTLSWTAPTSQGTGTFKYYEVRYAIGNDTPTWTTVTQTALSLAFTTFKPGEQVQALVRSVNAYSNGPWSTIPLSYALGGPYVKVNGVYKMTIGYVYTGNAWVMVRPYIYVNGQWRQISA